MEPPQLGLGFHVSIRSELRCGRSAVPVLSGHRSVTFWIQIDFASWWSKMVGFRFVEFAERHPTPSQSSPMSQEWFVLLGSLRGMILSLFERYNRGGSGRDFLTQNVTKLSHHFTAKNATIITPTIQYNPQKIQPNANQYYDGLWRHLKSWGREYYTLHSIILYVTTGGVWGTRRFSWGEMSI